MKKTLRVFKRITLSVTAFVLAVSSLTVAAPFFLFSRVEALGPITNIHTVAELRDAILHQADNQEWTIQAGEYGLTKFDDITVEGQTGWYLPITANNLTITGIGSPTLFGTGFTANGNWSTQNFISVFGNNVTIDGLTLMPKVEPNKTIEVLGNDFILRNSVITPNTLTNATEYDNVSDPTDLAWSQDSKQWGGSLYFSHAGNHTIENVTINNAGVSFRYAPSGTHITFTDVKLVNSTNVDWINGYRYSSGFNNPSNTKTGSPAVMYHVSSALDNLSSVLSNMQNGDTIKLDSDITLSHQLTLTKAVTFDGNGFALKPTFTKGDNDNNSALGIQSDNVTVNNLVVDGVGGTNLHGINVWESENVALNDVTVKNNDRSGLVANGSKVTVNNVTTENNGWHGINVDKADAILTVNGVSHHADMVPIYVDSAAVGQVIDTNSQYGSKDNVWQPGDRVYALKPVVPTIVLKDNSNQNVANNGYITTNAFKFQLTSSSDVTRYQLKYWNTITGSSFNGESHAWAPSDLGAAGHMSVLGAYTDNFSQGEGAHYFAFSACTAFGICSDFSEPFVTMYDHTAPAVPIHQTPANGVLQNVNDFWFDWNDVSGAVSYEMQNSTNSAVDTNGSFQNVMWTGDYQNIQPTESKARSVGATGTWYWQVRAVDAAGNKSAWTAPWAISLDVTAPSASTLNSPSDNAVVKGASLTQSWNASSSSDVDHYVYESYNDADATSLRWSQTVNGLNKMATNVASSTFWWRVKAVDNAGNVSAWSPLWKLTIDNDAPGAPITTSAKPYYTNANTASKTLTWVSGTNSSDVAYYEYAEYYNTAPTSQSTAENWLKKPINGTSTTDTAWESNITIYWRVRAVDFAGNKSLWSDTGKIITDTDAPVVTLDTIASGEDTTPTITGTTSELGGDVTVILDGATQGTTTSDAGGNWSWTSTALLAIGSHMALATATDAAGNVSMSTTTTDQAYWKQFAVIAPVVVTPVAPTISTTQGVTAPLNTTTDTQQVQTVTTAGDTAVLGEQDATKAAASETISDQAVAGASDQKDAAWNIFSIAWYWWLVALAVLAAIGWFIAAWRRRNENA